MKNEIQIKREFFDPDIAHFRMHDDTEYSLIYIMRDMLFILFPSWAWINNNKMYILKYYQTDYRPMLRYIDSDLGDFYFLM